MTHVGRRDAVLLEPGRLEGKDAEDAREVAPHPAHAPGRPAPDLRSDVVEDGNVPAPGETGEDQVEARVVEEDDEPRLLFPEEAVEGGDDAEQAGDRAEDGREADQAEADEIDSDVAAGGAEALAAETDPAEARAPRVGFLQEPDGVPLGRHVADGEEDRRGRAGLRSRGTRWGRQEGAARSGEGRLEEGAPVPAAEEVDGEAREGEEEPAEGVEEGPERGERGGQGLSLRRVLRAPEADVRLAGGEGRVGP